MADAGARWCLKDVGTLFIKAICTAGVACLLACAAQGQDLEPRRYAALPKNLDAIAFAYGLSKGNVISDPALPISDFSITSHNFGLGYVHTFGLLGKLARVSANVPFTYMVGRLVVNGHDTSGARSGFNDAQLRFGINLTGTPALSKRAFAQYEQKTIIGFNVVINIPTGLYHRDRLVNTGSNRWAFKPEAGISKRFKHVYAEAYAGVWLYLRNDEYAGTKTLEQKPMFSIQAHACYYFRNKMWVSADGTWFNGGQTYVDDVAKGDLFDNWRVGGSWSCPVTKQQSLKLQFHVGAFATRGYNYNLVSVVYQYVFL